MACLNTGEVVSIVLGTAEHASFLEFDVLGEAFTGVVKQLERGFARGPVGAAGGSACGPGPCGLREGGTGRVSVWELVADLPPSVLDAAQCAGFLASARASQRPRSW
ncbi:MAG: hypothetical protein ACLP0J_29715 [Solirubrobacteraceae bacterium]